MSPSSAPRRLAVVAAVLATGLAVSGCSLLSTITGTEGPVRDEDGQVVEGNEQTDVFTLRVGDCLNDVELDDSVSAVPTVPCAEPHDSEIYASYILGVDEFPGLDVIFDEASDACQSAFEEFLAVDYLDTRFDFAFYYPTESSWAGGDREILCIVYDPAGEQVTGTLEGIGE